MDSIPDFPKISNASEPPFNITKYNNNIVSSNLNAYQMHMNELIDKINHGLKNKLSTVIIETYIVQHKEVSNDTKFRLNPTDHDWKSGVDPIYFGALSNFLYTVGMKGYPSNFRFKCENSIAPCSNRGSFNLSRIYIIALNEDGLKEM